MKRQFFPLLQRNSPCLPCFGKEENFSLVIVSLVALACICLAIRLLRKRWGWTYSWTWKLEAYLWPAIRNVLCVCECFSGSPSESEPVKNIENVEMSEDSIDDSCLTGSSNIPKLNESDLKELISFINESDGGSPWQPMMEKSTTTLAYRAWYRDSQNGPIQYRTRTIFKNVSPEVVRDFFWDDEFRSKWDKMLIEHRTLHVCRKNGSMLVQWIRKLPVICSEREYIIVRRMWESRSRYYCVTKGTEYSPSPKRRTPRRVELYYSSYLISSVEVGVDGQEHTEVLLFHYEDSGLPKEIVGMAARAGMWGLVRRMDNAVRSYSIARANGAPRSEYALHAAVTTEFGPSMVPVDHLGPDGATRLGKMETKDKKRTDRNVAWWLVVGGIVIASWLTIQVAARKRMPMSGMGRCWRRFPMNKN